MKKLFSFAVFLLIPFTVSAETVILAPITTNTTWTAASGPFLVGLPITVHSGATLTIEPGTVVKFTDQSAGIEVQAGGTLNAQGTSVSPIYFTSFSDDIGGDTNGDGSATTPTNRQWGRIVNFGVLNLAHTTVRYGGYIAGGLSLRPASITTLTNAVVHDMGSDGISQTGGALTVTSSTISNNGKGLDQSGGTATCTSSTFLNNTQGFEVQGTSTTLTLINNIFTDNNTLGSLPSLGTFVHTGNTATGGTLNGFQISGTITQSRTLTESDLPYIVNGVLTVQSGGELILNAGATLKFRDTTSGLDILAGGTLTGTGTTAKPITFSALTGTTDRLWGRIVNRGVLNLTHATISNGGYVAGGLTTTAGSLTTLDHVTLSQMGSDGISNGGITTITYTSITGNGKGIDMVGGTLSINQSAIHNNSTGIDNGTGTLVDATNNWWGDVTGPQHATNPTGAGDTVSGNVDFTPWLESDPTIDACPTCSNVMFIPGLMGSVLVNGNDDQLWLSSDATSDYLKMNPDGTSVNLDIFAKGAISAVAGRNIYKSFADELSDWSTQYGIDSAIIPYDWRLEYADIVTKGKQFSGNKISYLVNASIGEDPYIIKTLKQLAETSSTGKVTIVAHSQGGLVAKALTNQLGNTQAAQYIDKIVFIATPHLGAPKAVAGLMHGTDLSLPLSWAPAYLTNKKARELGLGFPSAYNLIPSQKYFNTVATPVVTIDPATLANWSGPYGASITNRTQLNSFMGNEYNTRSAPAYADIVNPAIADVTKLNSSQAVHTTLDNWVAPNGIQTYAIAGWGEETIAGIHYTKKKECPLGQMTMTPSSQTCAVPLVDVLKTQVITAIEGDETVPVASAQSNFINRFWIDLYTRNNGLGAPINRKHSDILEVSELREFTLNIVKGINNGVYPAYISPTEPSTVIEGAKHFTLHSPLTLGFEDSQGRFVGMKPDGTIVNEIPHAHYEQIGETQWLSVPDDVQGALSMQGIGNGSFALDIEQIEGNTVVSQTSYEAVPVVETTKVTIPVVANEPATSETTELVLDYDGNGTPEESLTPDPSGVLIYGFKKLTLTPDNQRIPLGADIPILTYTLSGFSEGDTVENSTTGLATCTTTATATSPIGTYPITCTSGNFTSSTYVIYEFAAGTLTIAPTLTVTAGDVTIPQEADIPTLTANISGFINGDTAESATTGVPDCTTTATNTSPAGNYPITCAIGTLASDTYIVTTYVDGILTILPQLTVTADDKVITEGNTIPVLTFSITGFLNGDTQASSTTGSPECTTTAIATSVPGAYPITCTQGTLASSTYAFTSFIDGTLTIEPAIIIRPLTVTAHNKTIVQGNTLPTLTYSLSGFVNGDTQVSATTGQPLCTTTATSTSPVGTYPITCTEGTLTSATYTFSDFIAGTLTISDGTPPELQTRFDQTLKDTVISALDSVDEQPTITYTGNTITLTDSANNVTSINLTKYKESATKLKLTYNSITRNGVTTQVPNTTIEYDWSLTSSGMLKDLDSKVKIHGTEKYTFMYNKSKDETKIKVKTGNSHTTTTRDGFVSPVVVTSGGGVEVTY